MEKLKEEYRKPFGFDFNDDLPDLNKVYYEFDEEIQGPFNSLQEAKEYFMDNAYLSITVIDCPLDYEDLSYYMNDSDLEDYEDEIDDWSDRMNDLLNDLDIDYNFESHEMEGTKATLIGTPNNLIQFMDRYTTHWEDDGTEGEPLFEEKRYLIQEIDKIFSRLGFFK